jgi:hypothetical protein
MDTAFGVGKDGAINQCAAAKRWRGGALNVYAQKVE